ncbi:MAG: alkyl hydroperoxide reductase [Acidiferrobacteraceae bacterium]|nr:alkyl hydroperoxide reductase [Acidiferrobacteraceae bacterium]
MVSPIQVVEILPVRWNYRIFVIGCLRAYLLVCLSSSLAEAASLNSSFRTVLGDNEAQPFQLENIVGDVRSLTDYRGYSLIVNFWATWCSPCLDEFPALQAFVSEFADSGIKLVAINVGEDVVTIEKFLQSLEGTVEFEILMDPNMRVVEAWSVKGIPTTYLINRKGFLVDVAEGGVDFGNPEIKSRIRKALDIY